MCLRRAESFEPLAFRGRRVESSRLQRTNIPTPNSSGSKTAKEAETPKRSKPSKLSDLDALIV